MLRVDDEPTLACGGQRHDRQPLIMTGETLLALLHRTPSALFQKRQRLCHRRLDGFGAWDAVLGCDGAQRLHAKQEAHATDFEPNNAGSFAHKSSATNEHGSTRMERTNSKDMSWPESFRKLLPPQIGFS